MMTAILRMFSTSDCIDLRSTTAQLKTPGSGSLTATTNRGMTQSIPARLREPQITGLLFQPVELVAGCNRYCYRIVDDSGHGRP